MNQITKIASKNDRDFRTLNDLKWLDEQIERRFEAENLPRFGAKNAPSFYPGYDAEEVDDGRLEPVEKTGFVSVGEIRNTYRKESWTELPVEPVSPEEPTPTVTVAPAPRSAAPASNRNYRKEYRSKLPPLKNVMLRRGDRTVPYQPVPYSPVAK